MKARSRLAALALVLASCADPAAVDPLVPLFVTDATSYQITERANLFEVRIPFSFENKLDQPIYLERCGGVFPPVLERKVGDGWRQQWIASDTCVSALPYVLAPGATYVDTAYIWAHPFGGEREPQFTSQTLTGVHRLQWPSALESYEYHTHPPGPPIPLRYRTSNEFQLQGP
jgi:hypothetical protein